MQRRWIVPAAVLLFLAVLAPAVGAQPRSRPAVSPSTPRETAEEAPVVLDGRTLFVVRERVLSFSPGDRARAVSERISRLAKERAWGAESVQVLDAETTTEIVADGTVIMSVTERDAAAEGRPRRELAEEFARRIGEAVAERSREYSLHSILFGVLYAALATAALIVLLVLLRKVHGQARAKVESWRGTRIRALKIQSVEILTAARMTDFLLTVLRGLRVVVILGLLYLYIPLVLGFFPWTRTISGKLFEFVLTPLRSIAHAVWSTLPDLFFIAVIVVVTHYVIRFVRFFFGEVEKGRISLPGFFPDWAKPTFKIVRFLLIAFAAVVAFPYIPGSESPAFRGVSIFLGVLFSLGSTSAVANVVAGVILTYMRAFRVGDRVRIADTVGDVVEATLLVARIRTIKNVDVTIPNSMVLGSHITNFSSSAKEPGLVLNTTVTIGYDAPWRKVHELLIAAARATEYVLEMPAPFVLQTSLNDFHVSYELNCYTNEPLRMAATYSELHQNIQDRFHEAGVEILSPHYRQIRDGGRAAIPEEYLPADYSPPPIRVSRIEEPARASRGGSRAGDLGDPGEPDRDS